MERARERWEGEIAQVRGGERGERAEKGEGGLDLDICPGSPEFLLSPLGLT